MQRLQCHAFCLFRQRLSHVGSLYIGSRHVYGVLLQYSYMCTYIYSLPKYYILRQLTFKFHTTLRFHTYFTTTCIRQWSSLSCWESKALYSWLFSLSSLCKIYNCSVHYAFVLYICMLCLFILGANGCCSYYDWQCITASSQSLQCEYIMLYTFNCVMLIA